MELKVSGMTCQGCVRSVTAIVAKTLGVEREEVEVELEPGVARFPEASAEQVAAVVEKLGKQGFEATVS